MLNVHASLLPRWRGAAPIIYAILNGDSETGVTIMQVKAHKYVCCLQFGEQLVMPSLFAQYICLSIYRFLIYGFSLQQTM
jgi:hypothetical protein